MKLKLMKFCVRIYLNKKLRKFECEIFVVLFGVIRGMDEMEMEQLGLQKV
jgi:hypothetical protein